MLTHTAMLFVGLMLGAFVGMFLHAILSVSSMADQCAACRERLVGAATVTGLPNMTDEPACKKLERMSTLTFGQRLFLSVASLFTFALIVIGCIQ